jgi:hypothetical protein
MHMCTAESFEIIGCLETNILKVRGDAALTQIQLTRIKIPAQVTDLHHAIIFMPNDEKH